MRAVHFPALLKLKRIKVWIAAYFGHFPGKELAQVKVLCYTLRVAKK
ncbi:hypothetical protein RUMHYD_02070 [Blautia hydrogenotrophica DSM 10507]|uniref:Uncharacterized protein n=1 Tax=Blautia hydrogenotrophica (strain DSM 10507 / JCM 14656 / S5a33) TaxID=476272 RepID=C0CMI5_BLAHS|nr:hypothetical protein RUMHYD_02070 [Blautia hydrogenotrophica DSM 10507]